MCGIFTKATKSLVTAGKKAAKTNGGREGRGEGGKGEGGKREGGGNASSSNYSDITPLDQLIFIQMAVLIGVTNLLAL